MPRSPKPKPKIAVPKDLSSVLFVLSDSSLHRLIEDADAERKRRTLLSLYGADPLQEIRGQEMAKRALTVAVAGSHSILFCGGPATGKTMLRAVCHHLGLAATYEAWPCPCGNCNDPRRACSCKPAAIIKYRKEHWPATDIWIETPPVPEKEMQGTWKGTGIAEIRKVLDAKLPGGGSLILDDTCSQLMRTCVSELGLSAKQRSRIIVVARTIADLGCSSAIQVQHLTEAVNYRTPLMTGL